MNEVTGFSVPLLSSALKRLFACFLLNIKFVAGHVNLFLSQECTSLS